MLLLFYDEQLFMINKYTSRVNLYTYNNNFAIEIYHLLLINL